MNHSCDPTVEIIDYDLWVTRRDVKQGEELSYDYAMSEVAFSRLPSCLCGSQLCRGKVTKDDYRIPEVKRNKKKKKASKQAWNTFNFLSRQLRRRYMFSFSSHVLARIAAEPSFFGPNK